MNLKQTLLYVDDEMPNLLLFKYKFQKNYIVITASSGIEGLEKLSINPEISVIISDKRMPEMDGLDFLVLAKRKKPELLCVLLTAFKDSQEINDALEEGIIHSYLCKPFKMAELDQLITDLLFDDCNKVLEETVEN
jgi:response regulator RpfG family c-di-GMP phosphodiesterase